MESDRWSRISGRGGRGSIASSSFWGVVRGGGRVRSPSGPSALVTLNWEATVKAGRLGDAALSSPPRIGADDSPSGRGEILAVEPLLLYPTPLVRTQSREARRAASLRQLLS